MYNMTNITNANNAYEIVKAVNDISGGLIFTLVIFSLFFILLVAFRSIDFKARLVGASFILTLISIMAFYLEFIGWHILIAPILIFLSSIIIYQFVD